MHLFADSLWELAAVLTGVFVLAYLLRDSPLLSVCPHIQDSGDRMIARTSWRGWLLLLTLLSREVVIDANAKMIFVKRRLFWLFVRQRRVAFREIEGIYYLYEDWEFPYWFGNTKDSFSVKLRLTDGERLHLFNFWGEGTYESGFDGAFPLTRSWWRRHVDAYGSQERDSRTFVDRLHELTKKKLL